MKYPETIYVRKEGSDQPVSPGGLTCDSVYFCCAPELERIVPLSSEPVTIGVYRLVETKEARAEIVIKS